MESWVGDSQHQTMESRTLRSDNFRTREQPVRKYPRNSWRCQTLHPLRRWHSCRRDFRWWHFQKSCPVAMMARSSTLHAEITDRTRGRDPFWHRDHSPSRPRWRPAALVMLGWLDVLPRERSAWTSAGKQSFLGSSRAQWWHRFLGNVSGPLSMLFRQWFLSFSCKVLRFWRDATVLREGSRVL
jgi:hypothetical protein